MYPDTLIVSPDYETRVVVFVFKVLCYAIYITEHWLLKIIGL